MGKVNATTTRIETMFAFIAVDDEDDTEGICSFLNPETGMHMPLIGADEARVESMRKVAEMIGREANLEIRLVQFEKRVDIETLKDGEWKA